MKKREISIIGLGALGTVLTRKLGSTGFSIKSVFNRHDKAAHELAVEVKAQKFGNFPSKKEDMGDVVFVTVPDRHIGKMAKKLARLAPDFQGTLFVHCSGTQSAAILEPLNQKGAAVASFHPIQTFTPASDPSDFFGIYIDIEGEEEAKVYLTSLCEALGCHPMDISAEAKPYLHAAAVMASNYLPALLESAGQIAELGSIDKQQALDALLPLVNKTLQNINTSESAADALSGPVVRGDVSTINHHLKLLEQNPRLQVLYRQLGFVLANLAAQNYGLTTDEEDHILTLFEMDENDG